MNRKLLLAILVAFLPFLVNAQIVIDSTEITQVGDTFTRHSDAVPPSFGPVGAGVVWDWRDAGMGDTTVSWFVDPATTPYSADYPTSTQAITSDNVTYLYFELDATAAIMNGAAGDLLGDGNLLSTPFSPELLTRELPATFGTAFSDVFEFDVTVDGSPYTATIGFPVDSIRLKHVGNVYDTIDAYGTLVTPDGYFDAIRGVTTEYAVDSIWAKPPFLGFIFISETPDTNITYKWYVEEAGLAAVEMTPDSLGNPQSFLWTRIPSIPTAEFSFVGGSSSVPFMDESLGFPTSYHWDFGDGDTSNVANPTHAYTMVDTFLACLTVTNSMGSDTICDSVEVTTVVAQMEDRLSEMKLFPMPFNDRITISHSTNNLDGFSWKLMNIDGRELINGKFPSDRKHQLDLSGIPSGMYFIELIDNKSGNKKCWKVMSR